MAERPNHLIWMETEWVDERCGCAYHPDDDNGTHGGGPHRHGCPAHPEPQPLDVKAVSELLADQERRRQENGYPEALSSADIEAVAGEIVALADGTPSK